MKRKPRRTKKKTREQVENQTDIPNTDSCVSSYRKAAATSKQEKTSGDIPSFYADLFQKPDKNDKDDTPSRPTTQKKNKRSGGKQNKKKKKKTKQDDPSMQYIHQPTNAPIIRNARRYFQNYFPNIDYKVHVGPLYGWRTVSKLAVQQSPTEPEVVIGLFLPKSHIIQESGSRCSTHHPSINKAISHLETLCQKCRVRPYSEMTGQGDLRYVCINVQRHTQLVQMTLVWCDPATKSNTLPKFIKEIIASLSKLKLLHSLWVHYSYSSKHDNAIFNRDGQWECKHGPNTLTETLDISTTITSQSNSSSSIELHFGPNVFRQANLDAFSQIIQRIRLRILSQYPPKTKPKLVELYGGVGTIGLPISELCREYICSDENPYNRSCFELSVSKLDTRHHCRYMPKNAMDMIQLSNIWNNVDIVIVDPPRKGLEPEVLQFLCHLPNIRLLVYVSCGFAAFQRDCDQLVSHGRYKLDFAHGYALFPGSDAVETLAFFVR